jgi:hypothetical protein
MPETSEHWLWPIWRVQARADAQGYGGISRFVVPRLLELHHRNVFTPGLRGRVESSTEAGARLPRIEVDKQIIQTLWWILVSQRIAYAQPPWNSGEGQEIRSPAMLLCRHGLGTCVDLAVLLAGACLNEGLYVWLVMLSKANEGHVGLAIRLGVPAGGAIQHPYGTVPTGTTGVSQVKYVDRHRFCADGNVLLIDPSVATDGAPDRSLDAAVDSMHDLLKGGGYHEIHLVDVAARQRAGDRPFDYQPIPQDGPMVRTNADPRPSAPGWIPPGPIGAHVGVPAWQTTNRQAPPYLQVPDRQALPYRQAPYRQAPPNHEPTRSRSVMAIVASAAALIVAGTLLIPLGLHRYAHSSAAGKSLQSPRSTPTGAHGDSSPRPSSSPATPTPGDSKSPPVHPDAHGAVPVAPVRVKAAALGQYQIKLTWARQPSATRFLVSNADSSRACPMSGTTLPLKTGPVTSVTISVTPGTCQCFRVRAVDGAKVSHWSESSCVSTPAIKVLGSRRWTPTRVLLKRGQLMTFTASGVVNTGQSSPWGPKGDLTCLPVAKYPSVRPAFPAPQLPCWALIARVGNGPPFAVGTFSRQRVASSGRLYLGVNDSNFSDNSDNWTVYIYLDAPPPRP